MCCRGRSFLIIPTGNQHRIPVKTALGGSLQQTVQIVFRIVFRGILRRGHVLFGRLLCRGRSRRDTRQLLQNFHVPGQQTTQILVQIREGVHIAQQQDPNQFTKEFTLPLDNPLTQFFDLVFAAEWILCQQVLLNLRQSFRFRIQYGLQEPGDGFMQTIFTPSVQNERTQADTNGQHDQFTQQKPEQKAHAGLSVSCAGKTSIAGLGSRAADRCSTSLKMSSTRSRLSCT